MDSREMKLTRLRRRRAAGEPLRLNIISPSDDDQNLYTRLMWSDHWIKYELTKALGALPEFLVTDRDPDLVLHLFGFSAPLDPGLYTVGWVYGHPDRFTPQEAPKYDHLFCYSHRFTGELKRRGCTVELMPGATSKRPRQGIRRCYYAVFVGNARPGGWGRPAVEAALETGRPFKVWGLRWKELLPPENYGGEYWDFSALDELYAAADFSLSDHHPDMRRWGFVSFRLFDILASGGFAVSESNDGIGEIFSDAVPQFSSGKELREIFDHFEAHPESREELRLRGMETALQHTWQTRAEQIRRHILSVAEPERPKITLDVSEPRIPDPAALERIAQAWHRLGEKLYPGSSTCQATAYHELPFPGLALPVHRSNLDRRAAKVLELYDPNGKYGVDLGCSVGGFVFKFQLAGARMLGIDYDAESIAVGQACEDAYRTGARFQVADIDLPLIKELSRLCQNPDTGRIDFCLWLSHFMWMVKGHGAEAALGALFELSRQCDDLWFETSIGDARAGDVMKALGLTSNEAVERMLRENSCYREIVNLGTADDGWHPRPIYHCCKPLWQWEGVTSTVTRVNRNAVRKQVYDERNGHSGLLRCLENEAGALQRLNSPHSPHLLGCGPDWIEMEFCGVPLTRDNLPPDWEEQAREIMVALETARLVHRDIRPHNLMVRDGVVRLIDFGWAVEAGKEDQDVPNRLGGDWKHPSRFDDRFSLLKSLRSIIDGWQPDEEENAEVGTAAAAETVTIDKEAVANSVSTRCGDGLPFISILIPTHNRAQLVHRAVASALSQEYASFEVVVVDDGSTDGTDRALASISDPRLHYVGKEHSGAPGTRNRAVEEARGDWVLWLDDDDELLPGTLALYLEKAAANPGADVIFGDIEYDDGGVRTRSHQYERYRGRIPLERAFFGCPLPNGGSMIRKSAYKKVGEYDVSFRRAHDYEWWSRAVGELNFLHAGDFVYRWYIHDDSLSSATSKDYSKVDTSFEARIARGMIERYSWRELFPQLDWSNRRRARGQAFILAATVFNQWRDRDQTLKYLERSRKLYPDVNSYRFLAALKLDDGDVRGAICMARCGLAVEPDDPQLNELHAKLVELYNRQPSTDGNPSPRPQGKNYVNITIVTYNRLDYTRRCLEALHRNTFYPHVVTVVDNGSRDGSAEWLREMKEKGLIHNLILHPENSGVAIAANDGWEAEDCDYYLKLDNDIVIQKPGWLAPLVELAVRLPRIGVVGYNFEPDSYPLVRLDGFAVRLKREFQNIGGCCILIPRRTHQNLGFWAEGFGSYGEEDADYGARVYFSGAVNAYMVDENVGVHLPDGRAARIDDDLSIHSSEDPDYRRFKEEERRQSHGELMRMIQEYATGKRSLYQSRHGHKDDGGMRPQPAATSVSIVETGPGEGGNGDEPGLEPDVEPVTSAALGQWDECEAPDGEPLKVVVYSAEPPFHACPFLRVWGPLSYSKDIVAVNGCIIYEGLGIKLRSDLATQADLILFQRNMITALSATERVLDIARRRGVPVVFELDDDLMGLPPEHPHCRLLPDFQRHVGQFAGRFDAITVSTEQLAEKLEGYGPPVHVLPNLIDPRLWRLRRLERPTDRVIIGYMGTPTHREDLECVIPALEELLDRHAGSLELWMWGQMHPNLEGRDGVRMISGLKANYLDFVADFCVHRPDIAIAPLRQSPFNDAKSAIKFLEYSALRIPGVYSRVGPYARTVRHGETGLVVPNRTDAWLEALETLIRDEGLRQRMGAAARMEVMRNWSMARSGHRLGELMQKIHRARSAVLTPVV